MLSSSSSVFSSCSLPGNMTVQRLTRYPPVPFVKSQFYSTNFPDAHQGSSQLSSLNEELISKLLDRRWALVSPDTKIHQIMVPSGQAPLTAGTYQNSTLLSAPPLFMGDRMMGKEKRKPSFYLVRDDLLHPLVNGNKARKLDALLPLIEDHSVTDVVTCGGCQSAHAAAVAVSCAERGLKPHLLLRGEQPEILTGYNLISKIYGNVTYVPRSLYANREEMLVTHAASIAGSFGFVIQLSDILESSLTNSRSHMDSENTKKVVVINEGAGDSVGLLGVIRLVHYLSQNHVFGKDQALRIIVDAGTGTTAVGLGLGAICLGLPWEVIAVTLADTVDGYRKQEEYKVSEFRKYCSFFVTGKVFNGVNGGIVNWVERTYPRKFGNVLKGEVEACQKIAQQTGILVDPVYTLAAWELSTKLCQEEGDAKVVMVHTGGTLGMFGLAQRYRSYFHSLKDG